MKRGITLAEKVLVGSLAAQLKIKPAEAVARFAAMGVKTSLYDHVSRDDAIRLCSEYGVEVKHRIEDEAPPPKSASKQAAFEAAKAEFSSEKWDQLEKATFPEIDAYMERAGVFVSGAGSYTHAYAITVAAVAEYMAFLDGKSIRQKAKTVR